MQIIEQSTEILSETSESIIQRIERRGRICYKSEDKITDESSEKFVKGVIKQNHNSVLEMAVITVKTNTCNIDSLTPFMYSSKKSDGILITGSVRAWREYLQIRKNNTIFQVLYRNYPILFEDLSFSDTPYVPEDSTSIEVKIVDTPTNDWLHTHVAVKFITDRSMSNELVRHRWNTSFLQESQRYVRYQDGVTFINPDPYFKEDIKQYNRWKNTMKVIEAFYISLCENGSSAQAARKVLPNSCKTEIIIYTNLQQWSHIFFMRDEENSPGADPMMKELMRPLLAKFRQHFPGTFDVLKRSEGGKNHD